MSVKPSLAYQPESIVIVPQTFVGEVVPQAENEFRRLAGFRAVLIAQPCSAAAFVDEGGPHLQVGLASHDIHIPSGGNCCFKGLAAFASLERSVLWVCSAVMPCQCHSFPLD